MTVTLKNRSAKALFSAITRLGLYPLKDTDMVAQPKLQTMDEVQALARRGMRYEDFEAPRKWAAITVAPRKEAIATDHLRRCGVWAYWPCYSKLVASGHRSNGYQRRVPRFYSVIPGYLFIAYHVDSNRQRDAIKEAPGLRDFLRGQAGEIRFLTEDDIAGLERSTAPFKLKSTMYISDEKTVTYTRDRRFKKGWRVTVSKTGPFFSKDAALLIH